MRHSRGFTLAEMAMAVAILSLLLFAAMVPFSTQLDVRNIADTRRSMDSIREALLGFAQTNGRLPCPANGATRAGSVDTTTWPTQIAAGAEQWDPVNNQCFTVLGVVPWTTLGTPETDSWGRRFTYRVAPAFADGLTKSTGLPLNTWQSWGPGVTTVPGAFTSQDTPAIRSPAPQSPTCPATAGPLLPAPTQSSFALCSLGDAAVFTRTVSQATPIGSALPAVFISYGKNGYGAWQPSGIRVVLPAANTDELANILGNTTAPTASGIAFVQQAFFSRNPTPPASSCIDPAPGAGGTGSPLCEFDDFVVTISASTLISRMVSAGKLP